MAGPGSAEFVEKKFLTKDTVELRFKALTAFDFTPGQFINIKIDDGQEFPCFRGYSISAFDNEKNEFELCVKLHELGRGSNYLKNLEQGAKIMYLGPSGKFILEDTDSHFFIGTGTGFAPMKVMIETLLNDSKTSSVTLIFGLRFEQDIFYKEFLESLAQKHQNFKFFITLSKPSEEWKGLKGRVTDFLRSQTLPSLGTAFYICGNTEMVIEAEKILTESGTPAEKIHTEKY